MQPHRPRSNSYRYAVPMPHNRVPTDVAAAITGEPAFVCKDCGDGFPYYLALQRHRAEYHTPPPEPSSSNAPDRSVSPQQSWGTDAASCSPFEDNDAHCVRQIETVDGRRIYGWVHMDHPVGAVGVDGSYSFPVPAEFTRLFIPSAAAIPLVPATVQHWPCHLR